MNLNDNGLPSIKSRFEMRARPFDVESPLLSLIAANPPERNGRYAAK